MLTRKLRGLWYIYKFKFKQINKNILIFAFKALKKFTLKTLASRKKKMYTVINFCMDIQSLYF